MTGKHAHTSKLVQIMKKLKKSYFCFMFAFILICPMMAQDDEADENSNEHILLGPKIPDMIEDDLDWRNDIIPINILPPEKDGILVEFWQGFSYPIVCILWGDDKLFPDQRLKPYPGYEVASLDPAAVARTIGTGLAFIVIFGGPFLILASPFLIIRWRKKRKRKQEAENIRSVQDELKQIQAETEEQQKNGHAILTAMNELETGNPDKLTWEKALAAADGDEKRAKFEYLKMRSQ